MWRRRGGFQRDHFKSAVADVKYGPVVNGVGIPDVVDHRDPDCIAELLNLSIVDIWVWIIILGEGGAALCTRGSLAVPLASRPTRCQSSTADVTTQTIFRHCPMSWGRRDSFSFHPH